MDRTVMGQRHSGNPGGSRSGVSADSPVSSTTHLLITHTLSIWHTKPIIKGKSRSVGGRCLCYTRFVAGSAMIVGDTAIMGQRDPRLRTDEARHD